MADKEDDFQKADNSNLSYRTEKKQEFNAKVNQYTQQTRQLADEVSKSNDHMARAIGKGVNAADNIGKKVANKNINSDNDKNIKEKIERNKHNNINLKSNKSSDKADSNKEKDIKEAKDDKEAKENRLGIKNKNKKGIIDKLDGFRNSHPVKNVAKQAIDKVLKPIKIKIMASIGALVGGLVVACFVLILILSPLMDIWPYIDGTVRAGANFTEKMVNFFNGFGFVDSKVAFFEEAEALNKFYDEALDMPLLLSTLFYPEIQHYDMTYDEHMAIENDDPVTSLLTGGPSEFVSFAKGWIKDVIDDSSNTYDENGLVYNANKIYRLRRLAAAMADRDGPEETKTLGEFLDMLGDKFSKAIKDLLGSVLGGALKTIVETVGIVIKEIVNLVTLDFDAMAADGEKYFQSLKDTGANILQAVTQLIDLVSFGFCSIVKVSFHPIDATFGGDFVTVTYKKYKFNKDNYDNYVKDYYFENTIEYDKLLPDGNPGRASAKVRLLNEIYANKETFEQIFLDYKQGSGEEYVDNCAGAIDNKIVKQLTLPIDTPQNGFNLSQNEMFGISNGYKQNGVILTSSNSGITAGSNVYSVYDGTVLEVHRSTDDGNANPISGKTGEGGNTANKTYKLTDDQYKALASQALAEQSTAEGVRFEITQMVNLYEKKGKDYNSINDYIMNSTWYSCSKQHMNPICESSDYNKKSECYCSKKDKYMKYTYTDEAVQIAKDVIENGNRTMPAYVTEHDCWNCDKKNYCSDGKLGDICKLEVNGKVITDLDGIRNRDNYIKDVTKIYTVSTKNDYYIFYSFADNSGDPFGYYPSDKDAADRETQSTVEQSSNYVTIKHEVKTETGTQTILNTVYTIYKYLGSIPETLKVGDHVSKGQVIGTVGLVNTSATAAGLVGDTLAEKIWWALINAGYSKESAAGVIGNLAVESGYGNYKNIKTNSLERVSSFDEVINSGYGFGIAGWTWSGFKTTYKDYLNYTGGKWDDEDIQIGYLLETIKETPSSSGQSWNRVFWEDRTRDISGFEGNYTYNKFKNATTPEIAAFNFCGIYENPTAGCAPAPGDSSKENLRQTQAREVYNAFKDKTMPINTSISGQGTNSQPGIYFEFQNSNNVAINPNNLFIKCAGAFDVVWPCATVSISDIFGNRYEEMKAHRSEYGEGGTVIHKAIDIENGRGAAYYSVCDGIVERVNDTAYHITEINCGKESTGEEVHVIYEHGDAVSGLKVGQNVKTGEKLGTSNGWGKSKGAYSYGAHLHFEVYTIDNMGKKVYQNPLMYLYGMNYDGLDDGNMTCSIAGYDGSPLSSIKANNYASGGLNREEINFKYKYSTGVYDQSDIYNDKGNFYN